MGIAATSAFVLASVLSFSLAGCHAPDDDTDPHTPLLLDPVRCPSISGPAGPPGLDDVPVVLDFLVSEETAWRNDEFQGRYLLDRHRPNPVIYCVRVGAVPDDSTVALSWNVTGAGAANITGPISLALQPHRNVTANFTMASFPGARGPFDFRIIPEFDFPGRSRIQAFAFEFV